LNRSIGNAPLLRPDRLWLSSCAFVPGARAIVIANGGKKPTGAKATVGCSGKSDSASR
jgi:hypothetical protein